MARRETCHREASIRVARISETRMPARSRGEFWVVGEARVKASVDEYHFERPAAHSGIGSPAWHDRTRGRTDLGAGRCGRQRSGSHRSAAILARILRQITVRRNSRRSRGDQLHPHDPGRDAGVQSHPEGTMVSPDVYSPETSITRSQPAARPSVPVVRQVPFPDVR